MAEAELGSHGRSVQRGRERDVAHGEATKSAGRPERGAVHPN